MALSPVSLLGGIDIRADVWHGVLQSLLDDPRAILSLTQTCTALHELADHEHVWQSVATACWRTLATVGRTGYSSYKRLVLDDNRCNAALALAFNSAVCTYRFQRHISFYECRLVQLQWWRTANSLRLYFDARGEADLRLPMSSSIAVVKLQSELATGAAATGPCSRMALAAGGGAAASPSYQGTFDLESMGTRLLVHAPDACHTFIQKPGHYKGVLIWHSSKTIELLKALLLLQPADTDGPPPEQHSPASAGCRSEAWEEWVDWQLQQEEPDSTEASSDSTTSATTAEAATSHGRAPSPVCGLLRNCLRHWCGTAVASSSSNGMAAREPGAEPGAEPATPSCNRSNGALAGCSSSHGCPRPAAPRHALVFCYANDLKWYHTMHTPDYSITPLAVASPQPVKVDAHTASRTAGRLCPSPQGRPYQQRGQVSKHLQRRNHDQQQLSKREEGQLAAAWSCMSGAIMQQPGALDQQLQAESVVQEQLRWNDLPPAVKARGEDWWV